MTEPDAASAWVADVAGRFDWRCWEGEAVVYMLSNGCTHELGAAASGVLEVLLQQPGLPHSEAQLLAALGDEPAGCAAQAEELQALQELLAQLAGLGLVERRALAS